MSDGTTVSMAAIAFINAIKISDSVEKPGRASIVHLDKKVMDKMVVFPSRSHPNPPPIAPPDLICATIISPNVTPFVPIGDTMPKMTPPIAKKSVHWNVNSTTK
jgi:hypothetical protein